MSDKDAAFVKEITPRSEDFSRWYTDVIRRAELADYSPVKGSMVIRPYGYAMWELMQQGLDRRIKDDRARQCLFPDVHPRGTAQEGGRARGGVRPAGGLGDPRGR